MFVAIGDQIADRPDFHLMLLAEGDKIRQARHGAVFLHNLANYARRMQTRQTRNIDGRLGMSSPHQDPAVACPQRKHVPRCGDINGTFVFVYGDFDRQRPIRSRDPGGHALTRLDRHGKSRLVTGRVIHRHHWQTQSIDAFFSHWQTDQTPPVGGHKVDRISVRKLRRDHQIAFVLAVLVIDQHEHTPLTGFFDDLFDGRDGIRQFSLDGSGRFKLHGLTSLFVAKAHTPPHASLPERGSPRPCFILPNKLKSAPSASAVPCVHRCKSNPPRQPPALHVQRYRRQNMLKSPAKQRDSPAVRACKQSSGNQDISANRAT